MTRLNSPKILDDMFFEACCDFLGLEKILSWVKGQTPSSQKHILEEHMLKSLQGAYRPELTNVNRRNQLSLNGAQTTSDCLM